jgi:hypothetical protein
MLKIKYQKLNVKLKSIFNSSQITQIFTEFFKKFIEGNYALILFHNSQKNKSPKNGGLKSINICEYLYNLRTKHLYNLRTLLIKIGNYLSSSSIVTRRG